MSAIAFDNAPLSNIDTTSIRKQYISISGFYQNLYIRQLLLYLLKDIILLKAKVLVNSLASTEILWVHRK